MRIRNNHRLVRHRDIMRLSSYSVQSNVYDMTDASFIVSK